MSPKATYIKDHAQAITSAWEHAVLTDLSQLASLERGALLDHIPEVLNGLALWVDGRREDAERSLSALADGHAPQRLAFGVELPVVIVEYGTLRRVVLEQLLSSVPPAELAADLLALNDGFDHAVELSVLRYTGRREYLRNRFLGILGHDLRNPLNAAAMASRLLLTSANLGEREHKWVTTIARSTERMTRMIGDVLDFAQGHLSGGIPTTPVVCDVGEICRAAVAEIEGSHPERRVRLELQGDLGGAFDRDRLFQSVSNLLSNAFQHGEGDVRLRAWESEARDQVFIRVANGGRAIEPSALLTLFDGCAIRRCAQRRALVSTSPRGRAGGAGRTKPGRTRSHAAKRRRLRPRWKSRRRSGRRGRRRQSTPARSRAGWLRSSPGSSTGSR
jgi:signal transduction histidine kinase